MRQKEAGKAVEFSVFVTEFADATALLPSADTRVLRADPVLSGSEREQDSEEGSDTCENADGDEVNGGRGHGVSLVRGIRRTGQRHIQRTLFPQI
jgi:hypothetical protein